MLSVACSKEPAGAGSSGGAVQAAGQSAAGVQAAGPSATGVQAEHKGDGFMLRVRPSGSYEVGKPGKVEVVLTAQQPYKCNQEYPYKLEARQERGVAYAQEVFRKDAVQLGKDEAVLTVSFTPESAGKKTVGGRLSFSVCTDERCLVEKRELALEIDVR